MGWRGTQKSKMMAGVGGSPWGKPRNLQDSIAWEESCMLKFPPFLSPTLVFTPPRTSEPVTPVLGSGNTTRALSLQPRVAASASSSAPVPGLPHCPPSVSLIPCQCSQPPTRNSFCCSARSGLFPWLGLTLQMSQGHLGSYTRLLIVPISPSAHLNKRHHHPPTAWPTKLVSFWIPPSLSLPPTLPLVPPPTPCLWPGLPSREHHLDWAHQHVLSPCCLSHAFQSILHTTAE